MTNATMNKILVIEDEPMVRSSLVELLEAEQFSTFAAIDGFEGVQLAQEKLPDLILCDVMMPELDGYDVLQILRKDPATATIPFIFLTAKSATRDVREGMNLGADDYLTKPFGRTDLLQAISSRLSKREAYIQTTKKQFNGLQESISYAMPEKLLHPIDEIAQTANLLMQDAATITAEDITKLGLHVHSQSQFLQRAIQNFLLYLQLEFLARDASSLKALRDCKTLRPGDFVMMFAQQRAKQYQRSRDIKLEITNQPIKIATDDFKKILEEVFDFAFSYACPNTVIQVKTDVEDAQFNVVLQFELEHLTLELAKEIERKTSDRKEILPRQVYETLDPGLGVLLIQRIAELYNGELKLQVYPTSKHLILSLSFPC